MPMQPNAIQRFLRPYTRYNIIETFQNETL